MIADRRDFISGLLLIGAGAGVTLYAYMHYSLGTVQRMGPGMFPFGAGLVLAFLGVLVIIPSFIRTSDEVVDSIPIGAMLWILLSVVAFALTIPVAGLAPAVAVTVVISSLADRGFNILRVVILTVGVATLTYLIFVVGLNLPIALVRWPL
jgi:putative Mn2+ efflux pump MntP